MAEKQNNIYIILESCDGVLDQLVNEKIKEGYFPHGGVFVKADRLTYVQAMVKVVFERTEDGCSIL